MSNEQFFVFISKLRLIKEKKMNLVLLNAPVRIPQEDYDIINKYFKNK